MGPSFCSYAFIVCAILAVSFASDEIPSSNAAPELPDEQVLADAFASASIVDKHGSSSFDDSVYYKIKWPEEIVIDEFLDTEKSPVVEEPAKDVPVAPEIGKEEDNIVWVTTAQKETYYCVLPTDLARGGINDGSKSALDGISPYQILKPLFTRQVCSYRLEQYWTYELCHGRYVRQFHEESTVQKVKGQEFFLGRYDITDMQVTEEEFTKKLEKFKADGKKRPTIIIEGVALPYIEFNMTGGTLCDLNNKPRFTRVFYVCSEDSKHELHSLKETFTCEYEAVILSPLLCLHSDFKINVAEENDISCFPVGNAPHKPTGLKVIETKMRQEKKTDSLFDGKTIIIDAAELSGSQGLQLDITIRDENGNEIRRKTTKELLLPEFFNEKPRFDTKVVKQFLKGELCLQGGTGWWKYEFCYGDKVVQYHEEKGQRQTVITLGTWDQKEHHEWLASHPEKKTKISKTPRQVSHFYGKGDVCAENNKPRQVEVKLKCRYSEAQMDSVALYLLEPKTCEYVLGIESSIVCQLLSTVDEDGIMHIGADDDLTTDDSFDITNPVDE